jgi:4-amino-4-deoxy-L-arabinose transferase-like glycosyltransferase
MVRELRLNLPTGIPLSRVWKHLLFAVLVGFAVRLFLIWQHPREWTDSFVYEELARNLIDHHVYGVFLDGKLTPLDIRVPGYPVFLAGVYLLFGRSPLATMLTQVVIDLATCILTALLASLIAPEASRERVFVAALWLAAMCPFTASYTAVVVTEILATFLTAAALVLLVKVYENQGQDREPASGGGMRQLGTVVFGGLLVGLATLVRPESPLLLVAVGLLLLMRWWRPTDWLKLLRSSTLLAVGLAAPLLPWAVRNWHTLHTVEFLTPRYYAMPGDYVPRGFYAWTNTWLVRMRDVHQVFWKVGDDPIPIENVPNSAFDSPEERKRVAMLLDQYNPITTLTPEVDHAFAELARERTARHPLRTYLWIPLRRSVTIWLTPRTESFFQENAPVPFSITVAMALVNVFYLGLALVAAWRWRYLPGVLLLVTFVVVRTAFFVHVETPEPRYVLVCFPTVLALGALVWAVPAEARGNVRIQNGVHLCQSYPTGADGRSS